MELQLFKPLWGHDGDFTQAVEQARQAGFAGIEGPAPADVGQRDAQRAALDGAGLAFIAEICTAGSYVPDRSASVAEHLADLEGQLVCARAMRPVLVNCIGGCDAWPEADAVVFIREALAMASDAGLRVCFETHRGRSLFNPWRTRDILDRVDCELTCDFSHWSVVCEGLGETEDPLIRALAARAGHIHGRVGFDQGPQVPDPAAPRYRSILEQHQRWWGWIWEAQQARGEAVTTMTPEFGPDGYQQIDPRTDRPVGDLWQFNCWLAERQRQGFQHFLQKQTQGGAP